MSIGISKRRLLYALCVLLLGMLSVRFGNIGYAADTAPSLSGVTPANGASNVAANSNLVFTFSEAVNAPHNAFSLECPAGTPVSFGVVGSGSAIITLNPTADLPISATCAWSVTGSAITDVDADDPPDELASSPSGSFTTAAAPDAAPALDSVTPADGENDVAVNSYLSFLFSEEVDVAANAFRLECPAGVSVPFAVAGSGSAEIYVNPVNDLPTGTTCTWSVTGSAISDVDANDPPDALASSPSGSFATAASPDAAPVVSSVTPVNGAINVAVKNDLVFIFSEAVTAANNAFSLECPVGSARAFALAGSGTITLTLNPNADLPFNTACQVTIQASAISDVDSNDPPDNLVANYNTAFTTVGPAGLPPKIFGVTLPQTIVGQPYAFTVGAFDSDGDPLTFSIQNKPAWASFNTASGLLSGTPTAANLGTTTGIVISVSDGAHTASLPAFDLAVVNEADYNHPPVLRHPQPPAIANVGQPYYYDPAGHDPDGDPLVYSIANKPVWASFDPATGIVQGTPTANQVGATLDMVVTVTEANAVQASASPGSLAAIGSSASSVPTNIQTDDPSWPFTVSPLPHRLCSKGIRSVFEQEVRFIARNLTNEQANTFNAEIVNDADVALSFVTSERSGSHPSITKTMIFEIGRFRKLPSDQELQKLVTVTLKDAAGQPKTYQVPFSLKVSDNCEPPDIDVNRSELNFVFSAGRIPAPQTLALTSNQASFRFYAYRPVTWVALSDDFGHTPQTLQVTIPSGHGLGVGSYTTKLYIMDEKFQIDEVTINVKIDPAGVTADRPPNCNDQGTVRLTALEVTQGMQNLLNQMPLVNGRRTFVRAHLQATGGAEVPDFSAYLNRPFDPNFPYIVPGVVGVAPESITVKPNPDRATLNDSLLFEVPDSWVTGLITPPLTSLTVSFLTREGATFQCAEVSDTVKDGSVTLPLVNVPALPVQWYLAGDKADLKAVQRARLIARDYLPIPAIYEPVEPQTLALDKATLENLLSLRGTKKVLQVAIKTGYGGGIANSNGFEILVTPDLASGRGADAFPQWMLVQEYEHSFGNKAHGYDQGLPHADPGAASEGDYPHLPQYVRAGRISDATSGDAAYYGIRVFYNEADQKELVQIYPPATTMDPLYRGKAGVHFLSAHVYQLILEEMQTKYAPSALEAGQAASAQATNATLIQGMIIGTTAGTFQAVDGFVAVNDITPPIPGDYRLRLETAAGTAVTTIPFGVVGHTVHEYNNPNDLMLGHFAVVAPLALDKNTNVARIVLLYKETVLQTLNADPAAPSVTMNVVDGGSTVTVNAAVADSNILHYLLEYSPDNGSTWQQVNAGANLVPQSGQANLNIVLNKTDLPGSANHQWRLAVGDGFYTTIVQQGQSFLIPNKPPTTLIDTGLTGVVVGEQLLTLTGSGDDLEDGSLSGSSLIWHSDRDGVLGTGATLSIAADKLSEGQQVISLEAIDSAGLSSITTITDTQPLVLAAPDEPTQTTAEGDSLSSVAVLQVYRNQPYAPPSLDAAGFNFTLGQSKIATTTLPIRNSGDGGALDWTVTATNLPAWVSLSQSSGQTPQNVVVTANSQGVAPGTYSGTLTFQSNKAVLNKTLTAPFTIEVVKTGQDIFLPVIQRAK